jgi:hypothetical protein
MNFGGYNEVLTVIGLSLIIIAWLEQIFRVFVERHLSFSPFFLAVYVVGAGVIVYGSFITDQILVGALYAVTVVLAFVVLVVLIIRRRRPGAF